MARNVWFTFPMLLVIAALAACDAQSADPTSAPGAQPDMPNPAAAYCLDLGNSYEIRTAADGSQFGVCILPDGVECDEWAYFRGECPAQEVPVTPETGLPNPASVFCEENGGTLEFRIGTTGGTVGICIFPDGSECEEWAYMRGECALGGTPVSAAETPADTTEDGWLVYRDETLGYTLHYPPDAVITDDEDAAQSYTIQGPLSDDEYWPVIFVTHRLDQEAYRPPVGVDLAQWLTDQNLIASADQEPAAELRQEDVQLAGTTAIHTRFDRSPQSYAYDKYFFVREGQLYMLLILHAGDREDWELYDHFLQSIRFE